MFLYIENLTYKKCKTRVLIICPALDAGGIEQVLYNYATNMLDFFSIDFAVSSQTVGLLENKLLAIGCRVFHISQIRKHPLRRNAELIKILNDGKYDIVHDNSGYKGYFSLKIAKIEEVPIRIAHAHTCQNNETFPKRIIRYLFSLATKYVATELFACGKQAAEYMWGKKDVKKGKVYILKNPIYTRKFSFREELRTKKREELHLHDSLVIGYVARLVDGKNHSFLFAVLKKLQEKGVDAKLVLVGNGELESFYKDEANKMGISNNVCFLGTREDVNEILNAFDLYVTPSLYEGFPVSLLEAQCNGLRVLASDTIPNDVVFTNMVSFLPLSNGPEYWASTIENMPIDRDTVDLSKCAYDVHVCVKEFSSFLLKKVK